MKLIIDIPEEDRKDIGNIHFVREDLKFKIGKAIMNGIPLDDVKAELQKLADDPWNMRVGSVSQGLEDAIEILDNIGETESENK